MSATEDLRDAIARLDSTVNRLAKALAAPERMAYTPREVAVMIGLSYERVLELIASGELKARKLPGARNYVVSREAITELLADTPTELRNTA